MIFKNLKFSGFSLFEILVVIAIITFIFGLSISFFSLTDNALVYIELEKLYAFALYLQHKSKIENREQYIIFDIQEQSYRTNNKNNNINFNKNNIETHKLNSVVKFGLLENIKGPPSDPKFLIKNPISFKNNKIIFYPDGIISSGTVYLVNKKNTLIYALSSGISQVSYLRRYKYNSNLKKWSLI